MSSNSSEPDEPTTLDEAPSLANVARREPRSGEAKEVPRSVRPYDSRVEEQGAITAVQKAMTNYDVFVHLSRKIESLDEKADTRHAAMQTAFFERLGVVEGEQKKDRVEISRMREGRFPQRPLWAIAFAILVCAVAFVSIASCGSLVPPPAHDRQVPTYGTAFAIGPI